MTPPLSLFLSYSHVDKPIARELAKALRKAGLRVWIDEGELRAGDSIISRISESIAEIEFVVALISENSISSKWCNKELALAVNKGLNEGRVRLLPIRVDDVPMPASLQDVFFIQFNPRSLNRLVSRLVRDVSSHQLDVKNNLNQSRKYELTPLSPVSSLNHRSLSALGRALINPKLTTARVGSVPIRNAHEATSRLVADHSFQAMEVFYERSVEDFKAGLNLAYGVAGLVEVAPVSAPWIRRLLCHRNQHVVFQTLVTVVELATLFHDTGFRAWSNDVMIDTFVEIKREGDWNELKRRLRNVIAKHKAELKRRYGARTKRYRFEASRLPDLKNIFRQVDERA